MSTVYPKRGFWYTDVSDKDRKKRITKNTKLKATKANKKEAENIARKIEALIDSKKYIASTGQSLISMVDLFKREHLSLKSKSHQGVFNDALGHFYKIVPQATKIDKITSEHTAKYIEYLKPRVANSTLLTYITYMKIFFNYLVEEEIIPRNPIRKKQIPKRIKKNIVFFNEKMVDDIMNLAKVRNRNYYKFLMMLLLSGQRPADVLELKVGNIDLENNIICFNISKTQKQILFPIYDELRHFIDTELEYIYDAEADDKIFKDFNSEIVHKRFQRIKKTLGITEKNIYTLKTFRKTFASYLASKGIDKSKIADLLGHDDVSTTRKYYSAVSTENLRNELNKIFNPGDDVSGKEEKYV